MKHPSLFTTYLHLNKMYISINVDIKFFFFFHCLHSLWVCVYHFDGVNDLLKARLCFNYKLVSRPHEIFVCFTLLEKFLREAGEALPRLPYSNHPSNSPSIKKQ